jgi:hydrogenase expression/formation protein HypC
MCLGVPHEVIKVIDADTALVRVASGTQPCFVGLLEQLQAGDWVMIHAGFAIERITDQDARENLRLIHQLIEPASITAKEVESRVRPAS